MTPEDMVCPDCDSEVSVFTGPNGERGIRLLHDDTCPDYQSRKRQKDLVQRARRLMPGQKIYYVNLDNGETSREIPDTFRNGDNT